MGKKVHFMGIGGSGMSAVAMIAKSQGYVVSGCDLQENTPYLKKLKDAKIEMFTGHDERHLKDVDILCVTPSVFYQNNNHKEVVGGKKKKIMTWQEFMGKYLQKQKHVVCITGTHGKSTTTTMAGLLFGDAQDATVQVGANVTKWGANYRIGISDTFVCEADEFYGNFLHYTPDVIVLNNIEFDHPEYFKNESHVLKTFKEFTERLAKLEEADGKTLIFNQDSAGVKKLLKMIPTGTKNKINLIGYTLSEAPLIDTKDSFYAKILSANKDHTKFVVTNRLRNFNNMFKLQVPGKYNVENALGVIALGVNEGLPIQAIKTSIYTFKGTERRLELLGEKRGVKVYDDYAHHPTAIKATLDGLRQIHPKNRIVCIVEPHMFSRTKKLLSDYKGAFDAANIVMIAPIYKSRDNKTFGVNSESIVRVSNHDDIKSFDSFKKIVSHSKEIVKKGDVIIVMGAGESYKLARAVLKNL